MISHWVGDTESYPTHRRPENIGYCIFKSGELKILGKQNSFLGTTSPGVSHNTSDPVGKSSVAF